MRLLVTLGVGMVSRLEVGILSCLTSCLRQIPRNVGVDTAGQPLLFWPNFMPHQTNFHRYMFRFISEWIRTGAYHRDT